MNPPSPRFSFITHNGRQHQNQVFRACFFGGSRRQALGKGRGLGNLGFELNPEIHESFVNVTSKTASLVRTYKAYSSENLMLLTSYEGVSKSFRTESITKYTLMFGITR
jgi:hypothetical protein